MNPHTNDLRTKPHYEILDGLRGVAAMAVVLFHILETFYLGDAFRHPFNHGYLAVDFFFLLSGFVVAYAYDDRWKRMTTWEFYKRRLIRLQPMVVMGNIIGALLFYTQAAPVFPLVATTPLWKMLLVMLVGFTMIPLLPSMDIRGWQEMHPLDGPAWSLFFEYVANILYASGLRKVSNKVLSVLVVLSAGLLIHLLVLGPRGDVIGGWEVNGEQLHIGFARLLFPFLAGMLLMRLGKRIRVRGTFAWCSLLLLATFAIPRIGGQHHLWMNGVYEAFAIIVIFPVIVAMGAGDNVRGGIEEKICKFLGDISYPLYITHYALIYTFTAWVTVKKVPLSQGAPMGLLLFVVAVTIAYGCLKLYDEPVRAWLSAREKRAARVQRKMMS
ncbi:MAG: acyltransferase [Edaphobacter sp.]|uniref:acyltransferase family protein n=1 Tax=Edaphobacter sp. TaxID=1934404 RepID=UPI0023851438|nr:acyltransferase [Edaphobacter sp.]MDE1176884.1 acyltransferase [Edaphobacter sp.]